MQELERVQQLGDHALITELTHSATQDRQLTVRLLAELGEVHARGLFRELGCSTMFDYATRKLGMSEAEAALRLRAAKLGRAFPVALEMLGRSELNLTTLSLLAPLLTAETLGLLHEARFKSKQQVLELDREARRKARCPRFHPAIAATERQGTTQPPAHAPSRALANRRIAPNAARRSMPRTVLACARRRSQSSDSLVASHMQNARQRRSAESRAAQGQLLGQSARARHARASTRPAPPSLPRRRSRALVRARTRAVDRRRAAPAIRSHRQAQNTAEGQCSRQGQHAAEAEGRDGRAALTPHPKCRAPGGLDP